MTEEKRKIDPNAKKPVVYMSDPRGIIQPVLARDQDVNLQSGWGLSCLAEYLKQNKASKPEEDEAPKEPGGKGGKGPEEGEYTLAESIEGCRTMKAFEAIYEATDVEINFDGMTLKQKKVALIEALAAAKAEDGGKDKDAE